MLIPIFFLIIIGIVIIITVISVVSTNVSGSVNQQHLRHRIHQDNYAKPKYENHQNNPIAKKSEASHQEDDFFKAYDDFFEQDDDPYNVKK
ncbi:MAG: hypothetical protein ACOC1L_01010 [Bacillota bacterium]